MTLFQLPHFIVEWSGKLIVNCIFQSRSVHFFEDADKNNERPPPPPRPVTGEGLEPDTLWMQV